VKLVIIVLEPLWSKLWHKAPSSGVRWFIYNTMLGGGRERERERSWLCQTGILITSFWEFNFCFSWMADRPATPTLHCIPHDWVRWKAEFFITVRHKQSREWEAFNCLRSRLFTLAVQTTVISFSRFCVFIGHSKVCAALFEFSVSCWWSKFFKFLL